MTQGTARASGLIERAIAEAIDAVAARRVRDEVVALSLRWAGLSMIPERGPAVASFVEGPLFRALEHTLGEASASTVRDELAAVAAMLMDEEVSDVRPSWPELVLEPCDDEIELIVGAQRSDGRPTPVPFAGVGMPSRSGATHVIVEVDSAPTVTDPAPRRDLPLLVVASSSPITLSLLSVALGGAGYIEPARDALALLDGLGRNDDGLIVLDCRNPTVQVETLLAMQPELPDGLRVVLFGEPPGLERHLAAAGAGMPDTWVCCGPGASLEDLAAVCRVLLG